VTDADAMTPGERARYADAIVRGSLSFQPGDALVVNAAAPHRELVLALAESAYRAGAVTVEVSVADPRLTEARIRHGRDEALGHVSPWEQARYRVTAEGRVCVVTIKGQFEPGVLAALDPRKLALHEARRRAGMKTLERARRAYRYRVTLCAWPTEDWARLVFPELPAEEGVRRLALDLLDFCRLRTDDPAGYRGWTSHLASLRRRAAKLTRLDLAELEVRTGAGTDLRFALSEHSLWRGGGEQDAWGRRIAMNVPTEENFVSPEAAGTEGTFRLSRPAVIAGRVVGGIAGEFRGGRLVRLEAAREDDRDWLARYLAAVPGADRCGEIALVDGASRVGATGRVYFDDLIDENAVAHFALGSGYEKTRSVPVGRRRWGLNRSALHHDLMIGTDDLEAVGITRRGRRVVLVAGGAWQV
jgi:aminopeptidase